MCGQVKVVVKIESEDDMLVLQVMLNHFDFGKNNLCVDLSSQLHHHLTW